LSCNNYFSFLEQSTIKKVKMASKDQCPKTPHVSRKKLVLGIAPRKFSTDVPETPVAFPKRGRVILSELDECPSVAPPTSKKIIKNTPASK